MNDKNVANTVLHDFTGKEEKLCLAFSDLLASKLRLSVLPDGVINGAVLVAGEYNDFVFFNELFLSIKDMDIFDRFINKPLLSSFALLAIEILEILDGTQVQRGLFVKNLSFSDVDDLNLSGWHEKPRLSVQPLIKLF
jgi:hypothetical protein